MSSCWRRFEPLATSASTADRWWGKGFTEWTNVACARPLFGGQLIVLRNGMKLWPEEGEESNGRRDGACAQGHDAIREELFSCILAVRGDVLAARLLRTHESVSSDRPANHCGATLDGTRRFGDMRLASPAYLHPGCSPGISV
jgi:hypothetical protein